jgi:hypothetical protein
MTGIPAIEFDSSLFKYYSVDLLEKKHAKLDFLKKPNNIYVLSTSNCQSLNAKLETNIKKIANLLQRGHLSNLPHSLPAKNIFRTTQYLGSISKIIERHNAKIAKNCNQGILKFLFSIPIINRLFKWYLKPLEQPKAFIEQLKQQNQTSISLQLEEIQGIEALTQNYKDLLKIIEEAEKTQMQYSIDLWEADKRFIKTKYGSLLIQKIPSLKLAKEIIFTKSKDSQKTYPEILNLSDEENVNQAFKVYKQVLTNLTLKTSIKKIVPASLFKSTQKAKKLVNQAYAQWHAQRILNLYSKNQSPSIEAVLGMKDKSNLVERYQNLLEYLKSIKPFMLEAENKLCQAMQNYLESQVNNLIDSSSKPKFIFNQQIAENYEALVNQFDQVKPLAEETLQKLQSFCRSAYLEYWQSQVTNLMNALSYHSSIFSQAQTLEEKLSIYKQNQNLLQKWAKVHEKTFPGDQLSTFLIDYQTRLKDSYEVEIQKCVPIYAESLGLYYKENSFQPDGQPSTLTSHLELNKDERWYQEKKQLFEQELAKLNQEEVSTEIYESIEAAYKQVLTGYKTLQEKQAALTSQSQNAHSIWDNSLQEVKSWIKSLVKKDQEQSFDLTEIKIGDNL